MTIIDQYLEELRRELTVDAPTQEMILEEVRGHLLEATHERQAKGEDLTTAEEGAIRAFGSVPTVSGRYNAVHPQAWHRGAMLRGIAWGAVSSWIIWIGIAFPLIVFSAINDRNAPIPTTDSNWLFGQILFKSMPFAYGLLQDISNAYWVLIPMLLLFGIIPFFWGMRASSGWRPGFSFGIGIICGYPWLLISPIYQALMSSEDNRLFLYLIVAIIWLLWPYAIAMSWLGHRAAQHFSRSAPSRMSRTVLAMGWPVTQHIIIISAILCLVCACIGATTQLYRLTPKTIDQQLHDAQQNIPYVPYLPQFMAPGFVLVGVQNSLGQQAQTCDRCYIIFEYRNIQGHELYLNEWNGDDFPLSSNSMPIADGSLQYETWSGGAIYNSWWLGVDIRQIHGVIIHWSKYQMHFLLSNTDNVSQTLLTQIAESV